MGLIKYGLALGVGLAIGYVAGLDNGMSSNYEIFTVGKADYVKSITLDKSYQLKQVDNDFFMGDMYHQMKGVQTLARSETKSLLQQKLGIKTDTLDTQLKDKNFLDTAEDIGKTIKRQFEKFKKKID